MEAPLPPRDSFHDLPRDSTTSPAADRTRTTTSSSPQTAAATSPSETVTSAAADTFHNAISGEAGERALPVEENHFGSLPPSPTTNEPRPSAPSPAPPPQTVPTEPEADLDYASASVSEPFLSPEAPRPTSQEFEPQQTHPAESVTHLPDEHDSRETSEKKHVMIEPGRLTSTRKVPSMVDTKSIAARSTTVSQISKEDEELSRRVWSLYEAGGIMSDSSSQVSSEGGQRRISKIMEESQRMPSRQSMRNSYPGADGSHHDSIAQMGGSLEDLRLSTDIPAPQPLCITGSIEDWDDLEASQVDRYGFIDSPYIRSSAPAPPNQKTAPKRVATALFLQSQDAPRRRALKHLRMSPSAPEMLLSPVNPHLLREKEDSRARKWREMAKRKPPPQSPSPSQPGPNPTTIGKGAGIEWDFDTKNPKLIRRTWKGIPDCWRGAAWHSFLTTSYQSRGIGQPDPELRQIYHELLTLPCSDDMQIDLDVPRTISSHVMFRRRYRGGQRLLFRVLHSLALYFPAIGYTQGMASLAATLLCYYDEETAFIMLVRLWQLRGLEKLYAHGFGGLMTALDEFTGKWTKGSAIQKKLESLNIDPTAYGLRWYLTLFNYSIPFAAQLRVWDVFMLLGDPDPHPKSPPPKSSHSTFTRETETGGVDKVDFGGELDVLHATGLAIMDGMKSIILKADFEEAMKNLTSFVPVKDEDMLMRVVKNGWKSGRRRG